MACDMVVALGRATVDGRTVFGHNTHNRPGECQVLRRLVGRQYALGETVNFSSLQLPQARQTYTVLGSQPSDGWGLTQGVNEHQLAVGCARWESRLSGATYELRGTDLVRLALERCLSARQAVDYVTDTVTRHGSGSRGPTTASDNIFMIADAREAFLVETAGCYWALLECAEVRAACDVGLIRQDWSRLAHGLAEAAIEQGWWPDDGSKLDFLSSLGVPAALDRAAMKRWGRAAWLLEQHNGRIDVPLIRTLLGDHFEGTGSEVDPSGPFVPGVVPLCRHHSGPASQVTAGSMVAELANNSECEGVPLAWYAFGPPCASVYFPVFLDGELPEGFTRGGTQAGVGSVWWQTHHLLTAMSTRPERWESMRDGLSSLQARFDQQAQHFAEEAAVLKRQGDQEKVSRLAGLLMQSHVELFQAEVQRLHRAGYRYEAVLETAKAAN